MGDFFWVVSPVESTSRYEDCDYYRTFKVCAAKIRSHNASVRIHANSARGVFAGSSQIILRDPDALALVDAWTTHDVSAGSSKEFGNHTPGYAHGKLDYTNEMEYQPGSPCVNVSSPNPTGQRYEKIDGSISECVLSQRYSASGKEDVDTHTRTHTYAHMCT